MKFTTLLIIALIFGCIIMFFGTHSGNDNLQQYSNCLADGNSFESCSHLLKD